MAKHEILGGHVHIYKRDAEAKFWQCAAFVNGRNHRVSTKMEGIEQAKDFAEEWYLELKGKLIRGEVPSRKAKDEKTFRYAAEAFYKEFKVLTAGERSEIYVGAHRTRLDNHILPFLGDKPLAEVTPGLLQQYRIHRHEKAMSRWGEPPARNTIHQEIVVIRQVMKAAVRYGWINMMPDLSEPYRKSGKISHRGWFSPDEYKRLYEATRERAKHPRKKRFKKESEQLHDFVLFMVNTGLRPDEAWRLQYQDVAIVFDEASQASILEIEVRGKRGIGYCKSMPGAVEPFRRLKKRNNPKPDDLIFPNRQREIFNNVLNELKLKKDRDGNSRTAYSLRHTYICLRLMEGADIYQIAKNCRTSVEMIEKYYASHLKNTLDTAAINVRKPKPERKRKASKAKSKPQ
jgi:integrase